MSLFFANNSAEAQSYPYQQQKQTEELSEEQKLQRRQKRIKRVERIKEILFDHEQLITLKGGVNFSKIDDGLGNTDSGLGYEAAIGLAFDYKYFPLYLELESGFKQLITELEDASVSVIPFRFGVFYKRKIGKNSAIMPGLISAVDLVITETKGTSGTEQNTNMIAAFGASVMLNWKPIILEPGVQFYAFGKNRGFYNFFGRLGVSF